MKRGLLSCSIAFAILFTLLEKSVQGRHLLLLEKENGTAGSEYRSQKDVIRETEGDGNKFSASGMRNTPNEATDSLSSPSAKTSDIYFSGFRPQIQPRIRRSYGSGAGLDLSHFYGFDGAAGGKSEKEQEKILRLMALLTSKEGGYAGGVQMEHGHEADFDEDEEDPPLDLGYYGNNPYPGSASSGKSLSHANNPPSLSPTQYAPLH